MRGTHHPCCPPAARGLLSLPVPPCLPLRISFPHTLRGPSPWNRSLPEMKIGKPVLNFCHYSSRVIWDRNSCTAQALQLCRVMLFSSPDRYRRGCAVCVWEGVEAPFFILFHFLINKQHAAVACSRLQRGASQVPTQPLRELGRQKGRPRRPPGGARGRSLAGLGAGTEPACPRPLPGRETPAPPSPRHGSRSPRAPRVSREPAGSRPGAAVEPSPSRIPSGLRVARCRNSL